MAQAIPLVIALHGFLGLQQDWDATARELSSLGVIHFEAVDLWKTFVEVDAAPAEAFSHWTHDFLKTLEKVEGPVALVGYSMGGRLALQAALESSPDLISHVVAISANPGLKFVHEREQRLADDKAWAKLFRSEKWTTVLAAWNSQSVLQGMDVERSEDKFDRNALACALDHFSLGRQRDLRDGLVEFDRPLLIVTGEKDEKFTKLGEEMATLAPLSRHAVLPAVGHRIPMQAPDSLANAIASFLRSPK